MDAERTAAFDTIALEFNADSNIWNPQILFSTLDFMQRTGMNALVLNSVRLLERVVYPGAYFGAGHVEAGIHRRYQQAFRELYRLDPGRRSRPYQNIEYLRWVARRAQERDIAFYLNNKELYFPDIIPELQPQLVNNGVLCPTDPFWPEFLRTKYDELFSDIPELAGTITSPATTESRLTIYNNRCTCDRCADASPVEWFEQIMSAIAEPAAAHNKTFVLRDFVFDRVTQEALAQAIEDLPPQIVVCLKYTPHDYYPPFPHNPRIGDVANHPQWVEFDAMGQYFGWGVAPAAVVDDTRSRLEHARRHGATGMLVRVDWEGLEGHSAFHTPNLIILHALARLTNDPQASNLDVYTQWADDVDAIRTDISPAERADALAWVTTTFDATWPIVGGTIFAKGCVLSDSSQFPVSVEHAYWLAEEKNSLQDWDEAAIGALDADADNVRTLIAEKQTAHERCQELLARVEAGHRGLSPAFHGQMIKVFRTFAIYVDTWRMAASAVFIARHLRDHGTASDAQLATDATTLVSDLDERVASLRGNPAIDWFPASTALSADRLSCLVDDVRDIVAAHRAAR